MITNSIASTDQDLLARVTQKDERALAELYDRYGKLLYGVALTILHDTDDAEDVLQEIFVQVWRKADQYNPEVGAPKNWLVRIAHNRAINVLRSRRVQEKKSMISLSQESETGEEIVQLDSGENPLLDTIRQGESESISRAMSALPVDQRALVELAFYEGYSHSEIAESLGMPLGTVKTRIRAGIQSLRSELDFLKNEAVS